ncbi:hypothetical protein GUJ93_ZPchr0006g42244 [Zizania palustris]|uniref:Uncharacterized protein n=1 Tax=Zizania palustris TaxID=103762 RepID=A0A8J5SRK3_ZIZPA|nr:hypothetical protein GUJ93_ZPchr0006g42244 [Zizania palustris]
MCNLSLFSFLSDISCHTQHASLLLYKINVTVKPLELDSVMESPVNLYKPKELYTATLVSAERLVGPQAHGETCHVVINHSGNVSYISGRIELWCHSFRENPKKHGSPNTLLGMVILLMDGLSIYVFAVLYIMILKLQRKTPQRKVIRAVILLVLEGGLKKQFSDWSIIRSLIASILSATIYALHDSLLQVSPTGI